MTTENINLPSSHVAPNAEASASDVARFAQVLRKPVIIWVVAVADDLYVRSVNGRTAAWFQGTQARHEGRIWAGGVQKDVTFVQETDPAIQDQVDAAYRTKYRRYAASIISSINSPGARAATIKLVPR